MAFFLLLIDANHRSLLKILLGPAHSVVKADAAAYTEDIAAAGADSRAP